MLIPQISPKTTLVVVFTNGPRKDLEYEQIKFLEATDFINLLMAQFLMNRGMLYRLMGWFYSSLELNSINHFSDSTGSYVSSGRFSPHSLINKICTLVEASNSIMTLHKVGRSKLATNIVFTLPDRVTYPSMQPIPGKILLKYSIESRRIHLHRRYCIMLPEPQYVTSREVIMSRTRNPCS